MTAENGGGAFVIIYILSVILLALPIMAAEILIGKRGKQNPINSLRTLSNEASFYFKNQSDDLLNRTTKAKKRFKDIVTKAFTARRKMIKTSLKEMMNYNLLNELSIKPSARPETLSVENYLDISKNV